MRTTIAILICKFICFVEKLFKRDASVFPGSIAKKVDKNVLDKIKFPEKVIVVTGSSGKGSTVNMIAHILKTSNKKILYNSNGSNINNAIITLALKNSGTFSHKIDADIMLLEMDERYISKSLNKGIITHMLITNITRDQPARNYHQKVIYDKIMEAVNDDIHMIVNIDDPLLNRIRFTHKGKITTYGIAKTKYDSLKVPNYSVDFTYCPKCSSKLVYESYHYGDEGIYNCPKCDFDRGTPDYEATSVNLEKGSFKIKNKLFNLDKSVFFAVYYTLAAITLTKVIGLSDEEIDKAINKSPIKSKRMETYKIGSRTFETIESKNENALSYLQSLNYITAQDKTKTIVMGFENVSRRYKYNDLSWLYDVDFELLAKDKNIDKIFVLGKYRYDVATRLEYARIDTKKIVLVDDVNTVVERVKKESKGDIYSMVCFDMTEIITNLIKGDKNE